MQRRETVDRISQGKAMIGRIKTWLSSFFNLRRATAEELRTMLFETSPLPQTVMTSEGIYLDANAAYCSLHGISRTGLIGKSPADLGFTTADELKNVLEIFSQNSNRLDGDILKYRTQKGTTLYVRIFAHKITIKGDSAILMVVYDISKQRMAEKSVKESERFLHTVLNSIPTRVFWKDRNSVMLGANQWVANDMRLPSPDDIVGKTDFDFYTREVAEKYIQDDQEVMNTNEEKLFYEEAQPQLNGTLLWKVTSKVPLKDTAGNVIGLLGTYDDITARKQAEAELKLARFSIDHATSSILWASKDAQIVDFNAAFCEMLQYSREELLALRIHDIDPLYTKEKWRQHWDELRQRQVLKFLTKQRRKDGKELDVEVRAHYLEFGNHEYNCAFVNDITERKQSDERLHMAHRFQQAVLNNIPSGVFWKDRESKYLGANTLFLSIANYKSESDLIGKTDYDCPWREQAETLRADDREVMENNISKLYYVEPLRNADGKIHYNEVSKVPLLNANGEVMGVLGTFRDITEQMEIGLALKESEKLFKSVVQNASAIIFIIDRNGIFRLSEGLGLSALGLRPGEVIGKSVFEMYKDSPQVTDSIHLALRGEIIENEISIYGLTFSTRYAPMRDAFGEITEILCVSFDITSRKKLEEALNTLNEELAQHVNELKESELKYRQIIQSNPMGIYVYEVNARGQLILVDTNPSADALTGIKNDELIGKTIDQAFPGLEHTEMPSRYLAAAREGTPWFIEDFPFNNGVVNGVFEVYAFQAGRNRVAVMFLNITERKQIEAAIKQKNEELLKANAELDRFVYSASHDLRAPIASLLGLIGVARAEKDMDNMGLLLDMQERSLNKLDNFIHDIVSYSRNNRVTVETTVIDFRAMIEGIFEQLYYMDELIRVEKRIVIPGDLRFTGDEKRIAVILNNLISNAIKYADISKPNSFVEVSVNKSDNGVVICVSDNGEGIAMEYLPKIFDMFFRATQRSTGSGIGLYIVNEMVHKMEGKIEVTSVKGEGSKFQVMLPDLSIFSRSI